ncbi:MAG: 1-acyl-sn-glycerol-3-phosphate acyltransferase [Rickettsiales bacterium]|jgi:1-acyl-sn-glycerol-3-phosphate acyltransferase|nr:1-acyl-sn-glycerol-3-phosphate acyltransferase [Rickettsiales bacterium]
MKKIIIFIKSMLFSITSFSITVPWSFIFIVLWLIPFVPDKRYKCDKMATEWGKFMLYLLKIFTGIKWNITGYDKLEKKPYIIVGKHESTWETLVMHSFMKPSPIFILKKQLLFVPFMGWCLATANNIPINRGDGIGAIRKILKDGKKYIKKGHSLIIFPQGTRVLPESTTKEYPYKVGFIGIIKEFKVDIVPMALNSGKYWSKKKFLKEKGTIRMEFLPPIKYEDIENLKKEDLLLMIENIIEKRSLELSKMD